MIVNAQTAINYKVNFKKSKESQLKNKRRFSSLIWRWIELNMLDRIFLSYRAIEKIFKQVVILFNLGESIQKEGRILSKSIILSKTSQNKLKPLEIYSKRLSFWEVGRKGREITYEYWILHRNQEERMRCLLVLILEIFKSIYPKQE